MDTLNVVDFGADPTGVEDSTRAVQEAFDRASELGGDDLPDDQDDSDFLQRCIDSGEPIPCGTYRVTHPLVHRPGVSVVMERCDPTPEASPA